MASNQQTSLVTREDNSTNNLDPLLEAPEDPIERLLAKVYGNGRYQLVSFMIFNFMWLATGWLLLGEAFFFDDTYKCLPSIGSDNCAEFICNQPALDRHLYLAQHANSIAFSFDRFLICEDSYIVTLLESMIFFGSLTGFFLFSSLADNKGRLPAIKISWGLASLGVVLISVANGPVMIGIGYFLAGFGSNPAITLCYSFINEQVLGKNRQRYGVAIQIFFALGQATIALFFIGNTSWRTIMIAVAVCFVGGNLLMLYLLETPKFLATRNLNKTLTVLNTISKRNNGQAITKEEMLRQIGQNESQSLAQQQEQVETITMVKLFSFKSLRMISISTAAVFLAIQVIYYSTIFNLNQAGYTMLINQEIIGVSEALGYITAEIIIHAVKRKQASYIGLSLSAGICFVLAILRSYESSSENRDVLRLLQTGGLLANRWILCCFWSIFYVYLAELFPTQVRSLGYGLASAAGTIGSSLSPYIIFASKSIGLSTWIAPGIIGMLGVAFIGCLPETRGRPLEEKIKELVQQRNLKASTLTDEGNGRDDLTILKQQTLEEKD